MMLGTSTPRVEKFSMASMGTVHSSCERSVNVVGARYVSRGVPFKCSVWRALRDSASSKQCGNVCIFVQTFSTSEGSRPEDCCMKCSGRSSILTSVCFP